jgi:hypothetical protein
MMISGHDHSGNTKLTSIYNNSVETKVKVHDLAELKQDQEVVYGGIYCTVLNVNANYGGDVINVTVEASDGKTLCLTTTEELYLVDKSY